MRIGVTNYTNRKGQVAWKKVKAHVFLKTGLNYGAATLRAKSEQLSQIRPTSMAILDKVQPIVSRRQKKQDEDEELEEQDEDED